MATLSLFVYFKVSGAALVTGTAVLGCLASDLADATDFINAVVEFSTPGNASDIDFMGREPCMKSVREVYGGNKSRQLYRYPAAINSTA